eukprot:469172_1
MSNDLSQQLLMTQPDESANVQHNNEENTASTEVTETTIKDQCKNCCQYFKIILLGVIICGCVSGIWSFLTHVDSIRTRPDVEINGIAYHKGIICVPATVSFYAAKQSYCNGVAESMAINSTFNTEWQCATNNDYSDSNIVDTFDSLRYLFYTFVGLICLASYFTIVHDVALLRKSKNGTYEEIKFWPSNKLNNCRFQKAYYECAKSIIDSWNWEYCESRVINKICCPFNALLYLIHAIILVAITGTLGLIDIVFMLVVYPFIQCKCNGSYCCSGMVEMSSIWIGICRTVGVIMVNIFLINAMAGIVNPITSAQPDKCRCNCEYLLNTKDVAAISATVLILTVTNLMFVWSWFQEARHQQWFLYLINYSLPVRFVHAVQPNDPSGSIVDVNIGQKIRLQVHVDNINVVNNDLRVYAHQPVEKDVVAEASRCMILFFTVLELLLFMGLGLGAGLPTIEQRGYSKTIMVLCSVISWIVFCIVVVLVFWMHCKTFKEVGVVLEFRGISSWFVLMMLILVPQWIELFSK